MNKQDRIIKLIKKYDDIALFFHDKPDFDALGSVCALKTFIKNKYPKKNVHIIDLNEIIKDDVFKRFLPISKETKQTNKWLTGSLGIICDTANSARIFGQRYTFCKETIKIDHHPLVETYAKLEWVNSYSSCCEMIGELLYKWDEKEIDAMVASYIYIGILTDTGRFFYPSTTSSTLRLVAKLYKKMKTKRMEVNQLLATRTIADIKMQNEITKYIKFNLTTHVASLIIPKTFFKKYKVQPYSMIESMKNVDGIEIWTSIYFDPQKKNWKGSIRSKTIDISTVASKYNGGGHKNASGFTIASEATFNEVIAKLNKLTNK
ncbi:MAG: bifunctional oligoribonuclease/PAP phosphatase NrnA [Mycoplasmataceae bacterium]|nr:bifunctional oligoribonuclease/PAP phosphatase NrnA [Mycoplasmataceae bacterium]